jgi:glycosyltransferase involved in cell wall biosynthesis
MPHADTPPLVSFCVPTYQRSRYLASLLECLASELAGFPYTYEVVIADNASPDDTRDVVAGFEARLPIRYLRHEINIGATPTGSSSWRRRSAAI